MRRRIAALAAALSLVVGLFAALAAPVGASSPYTGISWSTTYSQNWYCSFLGLFQGSISGPPGPITEAVGSSVTVQLHAANGPFPLSFHRDSSRVTLNWKVTGPIASGAAPASGTVTTNAAGNAQITFTNSLAGTDTLTVWREIRHDGTPGCGEPIYTVQINAQTSIVLNNPAPQIAAADGVQTSDVTATLPEYNSSNPFPASYTLRLHGGPSHPGDIPMTVNCTATNCTGSATLGPTTTTGHDQLFAYIDTNSSGSPEPSDVTSNTVDMYWVTIDLTVDPAVQEANSSSTILATATISGIDSSTPLPAGAVVRINDSGTHAGDAAMTPDTCNATSCTYTFTLGPVNGVTGTDQVLAYIDTNASNTPDAAEVKSNTESTSWVTLTLTPDPAVVSPNDANTEIMPVGYTGAAYELTLNGYGTDNGATNAAPLPTGYSLGYQYSGDHGSGTGALASFITSAICGPTSCSLTGTHNPGPAAPGNDIWSVQLLDSSSAVVTTSNNDTEVFYTIAGVTDPVGGSFDVNTTGQVVYTVSGFDQTTAPLPSDARLFLAISGIHSYGGGEFGDGPPPVTDGTWTWSGGNYTLTLQAGPTATAGEDIWAAYLDLNGNATQNANEASSNDVTVNWAPVLSFSIDPTSVPYTSTTTATLMLYGYTSDPGNVRLHDNTDGGDIPMVFGSCNAATATCTYTSPLGPAGSVRTDVIYSYMDLNGSHSWDANEPKSNDVTVNWVSP